VSGTRTKMKDLWTMYARPSWVQIAATYVSQHDAIPNMTSRRLTGICSASDCDFSRSNVSLSCGRFCNILWYGVLCLLPRIWERHSYYAPEGVLDYILIVANPVGTQQAYSQKAKGEVEQ
jgi:hypothetical protein